MKHIIFTSSNNSQITFTQII